MRKLSLEWVFNTRHAACRKRGGLGLCGVAVMKFWVLHVTSQEPFVLGWTCWDTDPFSLCEVCFGTWQIHGFSAEARMQQLGIDGCSKCHEAMRLARGMGKKASEPPKQRSCWKLGNKKSETRILKLPRRTCTVKWWSKTLGTVKITEAKHIGPSRPARQNIVDRRNFQSKTLWTHGWWATRSFCSLEGLSEPPRPLQQRNTANIDTCQIRQIIRRYHTDNRQNRRSNSIRRLQTVTTAKPLKRAKAANLQTTCPKRD